MYDLLKINLWLRHYMLHCKYTQHRSLLVLVSSSSGKKKCLNQSLCHKITESMTTYSFISYKLSPQFRYHCISQCHLEEMQRMVILASILDLLDLHEVVSWQLMAVLESVPYKIASWYRVMNTENNEKAKLIVMAMEARLSKSGS